MCVCACLQVYLRHNQYTGAWTLFMDGKKVKEAGASDYANGRNAQASKQHPQLTIVAASPNTSN